MPHASTDPSIDFAPTDVPVGARLSYPAAARLRYERAIQTLRLCREDHPVIAEIPDDERRPDPHDCFDRLDFIGGPMPLECVDCRRLYGYHVGAATEPPTIHVPAGPLTPATSRLRLTVRPDSEA